MAKASPMQTSFNAGEWSRLMHGRVDLSKYPNACSILTNFIPTIQGPAIKRSATSFIAEVIGSATDTHRLIPFEFSTTQAYVLIFGDQYMWICKDGGLVLEDNEYTINAITVGTRTTLTTSAAHGLSEDDVVFISGYTEGIDSLTTRNIDLFLNNNYWTVKNPTATTFEVEFDSTTVGSVSYQLASATAGKVHRVYKLGSSDIPWLHSDLAELKFAQSADVLYVAHPDYAPRKITRTAHNAWTAAAIDFDWQPFELENEDEAIEAQASHAEGNSRTITFTGGTPLTASHIGSYIKLRENIAGNHKKWETGQTSVLGEERYYEGNVYEDKTGGTMGNSPPRHLTGTESDGTLDWEYIHSGEGYAKITNVAAQVATVDIDTGGHRLPASTVSAATFRWAFAAWSAVNGYPHVPLFHENRLVFAATDAEPQSSWMSRSGDYENHKQTDEDESAIDHTINTDKVNVIEWMQPRKVLVVGTTGGEFAGSGINPDEPIAPGNPYDPKDESTFGSRANLRPQRVGNVILFVQRAGRKLLEFFFNFDEDSFDAPDLTVLAEHITRGRIKEIAFQQEPHRVVWCALEDGGLVAVTYERAEQVIAWHRHVVGGTDVEIESIASIPGPSNNYNELYAIVKRTIGGGTKRYFEKFEQLWDEDTAVKDAIFFDSAFGVDLENEYPVAGVGMRANLVPGCHHLNGETIQPLADGALFADVTVVNGLATIHVDNYAWDDSSTVRVRLGLAYEGTVQGMRPEAGATDGVAQGKTKRIHKITFRLDQTGPGFLFGPSDVDAEMDEIHFSESDRVLGVAPTLFSGDTKTKRWPGSYEKEGRVTVKHVKPYPCTILAWMPQLKTEDG
jgi:hypothetical protein